MAELSSESASGSNEREYYGLGYGSETAKWHEERSANREAAFYLPLLKPGMSLLDIGCGNGSITVDLAKRVSPGQVVGIDIEPSQIERAQALASEQKVTNVQFEVGSAYELPFADESFDSAFANTALQHLDDPVKALQEVLRVLTASGVMGTRDMDWGGVLIGPYDPKLNLLIDLQIRMREHEGKGSSFGRRQRAVLREAGFKRIEAGATYDIEDPKVWGERNAKLLEEIDMPRQAVELGWTDQSAIDDMKSAFRLWGQNPDAFFAVARCEAIGWKE